MPVLPLAIQRFIDATNSEDSAGVLEAFSPDAVLTDWGRTFRGRGGIAQWDSTDNVGVQSHLRVVHAEVVDGEVQARVAVRGNGFNGKGHMTFRIADDSIVELTIR